MKSRVLFENRFYSVCLTRAGLSVQKRVSGRGVLIPSGHKSLAHWQEAFETALDAKEAHELAKGFLQEVSQ